MRFLYSLLAFAVILFLAVVLLLIYAIKGSAPNVPSDLLAILGAYILFRIAVLLVIVGGVIGLLYWAVSGSAVATDIYKSASPEDKERLKQSFHNGISILKNIVDIYHELRKDNKKKK